MAANQQMAPGVCSPGGPERQVARRVALGRPVGLRIWLHDERGIASLEYLIVLSAVVIGLAGAVLAMGPRAVELFNMRVTWLSLPIP